MTRRKPAVRAPKPNHIERAQRHAAVDVLLQRALRGALTIPEAAVLAEYWREDQRLGELTRRRLGDTTRALERHRQAADAEIQRLEQRIVELTGTQQQEGSSVTDRDDVQPDDLTGYWAPDPPIGCWQAGQQPAPTTPDSPATSSDTADNPLRARIRALADEHLVAIPTHLIEETLDQTQEQP